MIRRIALTIFLMLGTCLNTGCLLPASYVAGYSNPKLKAKLNPLTKSFEFEAGTDFTGKFIGDYDPATKRVHVEGEVGSKVSDVNLSEAVKAEAVTDLQKAQMDMYARNVEALTGLVGQLGSAFIAANPPQPQQPSNPSTSSLAAQLAPLIQQIVAEELRRSGVPSAPVPP